jgi:VanZ family protein
VRRLLAWLPALLWMTAIFTISSRSTVSLPSVTQADKVAHAAAYAVLGVALAFALRRSSVASWPAWSVTLGWLYGASDEFHQRFVPGRSPDVADWVADAVGVVIGTLLFQRWLARRAAPLAAAPRDAHSLRP